MPRQRHRPLYPTPKCLGMKYAGLKIFIHFIQTTAKKRGGNCCSWTRSGRLFFPWAIPPVPENRESRRLMSNHARTGNACNLCCQSVSHALQFRSKYFSVTLHIYQHTWICRYRNRFRVLSEEIFDFTSTEVYNIQKLTVTGIGFLIMHKSCRSDILLFLTLGLKCYDYAIV